VEAGVGVTMDELGYRALEDMVHDLPATMPHLLGIDHKRLTSDAGDLVRKRLPQGGLER